jgi:hypothetical protein
MTPAGSLNIPRFEYTPMGRGENFKEERYHTRNPTYVPTKYVPPKREMIPIQELPFITKTYLPIIKEIPLPPYEPPKKHFWDKDLTSRLDK